MPPGFVGEVVRDDDGEVEDFGAGRVFFEFVLQAAQFLGERANYASEYASDDGERRSSADGIFAIVLGLLGFLYVASVLIVLCVEINAVRVDRLHPRALLTPFTDNVELAEGNENSYTGQAEAERNKGFSGHHRHVRRAGLGDRGWLVEQLTSVSTIDERDRDPVPGRELWTTIAPGIRRRREDRCPRDPRHEPVSRSVEKVLEFFMRKRMRKRLYRS